MKKILIVFWLLFPHFTLASKVQVINTGKDFQIFWQKAEGKSFEEQEILWSAFENKYREIYDSIVFDKTSPDWQNKRIDKLKIFFSKLPKLATKMNILFDNAEQMTLDQAERFKKTFPDIQEGIPVVFLPGLTFNGKAQPLPSLGRATLFVGVDLVAERNDPVDVLFSHEFFHIYQFELLKTKSTWKTFSSPLWFEGFATYVSGLLNPTYSGESLFMDSELSDECSKQSNIQTWSKEYLSFYDNHNLDENTLKNLYKDWFKISGSSNPKRRGYCLGFKVIQDIAQQNSIQSMVQWDEPTFLLKVGETLNNLSK